MIKIGIIAGGGILPIVIGQNLVKKNYKIVFFVIDQYFDKKKYSNFKTVKITLNSIKTIFNELKKHEVTSLILVGNIKRPSISDLKLDIDTLKFVKKFLLEKKGDNKLLISIQEFFCNKGFKFFDWRNHCNDLFSVEKNLTRNRPTKNSIKNLNKSRDLIKNFAKLDLGQSIIIQNQIILGVEAAEGTDQLITRCKNYKTKGDKGILVKFSKSNQSLILDIPTIGMNTVKLIKKFGYEGIFLEKNKCIILEKDKIKKYADQNNIFIATIN
ncbi:MAG: hypothetical protein CMI96_03135 [Pelagibacteraceae bacterium]|nr:hypothetical protein [Pelagibacteraceae bacterium]|tara:strand:+ start:10464 stop:11273 length:810 start_codon:yes stop_codon:yes gene_type:complete